MTLNMKSERVIVNKAGVVACLTCPLCNNLLKEATTSTECLHTFCRKCIHNKITEEKLECCPICNADLGETPLETMRPDIHLQNIRNTIFPLNGRKEKAPEVVPSVQLPAERKEF